MKNKPNNDKTNISVNKRINKNKKSKIKILIGISLLTIGLVGIGIFASTIKKEEPSSKNNFENKKITIDNKGNEDIPFPKNFNRWSESHKYRIHTDYFDNSSDINSFWIEDYNKNGVYNGFNFNDVLNSKKWMALNKEWSFLKVEKRNEHIRSSFTLGLFDSGRPYKYLGDNYDSTKDSYVWDNAYISRYYKDNFNNTTNGLQWEKSKLHGWSDVGRGNKNYYSSSGNSRNVPHIFNESQKIIITNPEQAKLKWNDISISVTAGFTDNSGFSVDNLGHNVNGNRGSYAYSTVTKNTILNTRETNSQGHSLMEEFKFINFPYWGTINNKITSRKQILLNQYSNVEDYVSSVTMPLLVYHGGILAKNKFEFSDTFTTIKDASIEYYSYEDKANEIKNFERTMRNIFPSSFEIKSDTGWESGGITQKLDPDKAPQNSTSNYDKLKPQLDTLWNRIGISNNLGNRRNLNYLIATGKNQFDLYLQIDPFKYNDKDSLILIKENIKINWKNSPARDIYLNSLNIITRFTVTPSKVMIYDDKDRKYKFSPDVPKSIIGGSPGSGDWGKWLYHGPIDLNFTSTTKNDEVLFIDGQKIDVLNNEFNFGLIDQLIDTTPPGTGESIFERKNEYEIKIKTFNQDLNGNNTSIKSEITLIIVIESFADDFDVSYFGWDPDKNPSQEILIQKFLLNPITGKPILDEDGNEVPNPKYDPQIDPKTGTKKQLMWVKDRVSQIASFKNITKFWPDPLNEKGESIIDENGNILDKKHLNGFLVEAIVIPKGITIKEIDNLFKGRYFLGKIEIGKSTINDISNLTFGKENDYISTKGIYLASGYNSDKEGLPTIKLIGFGSDDWNGINPPGFFSEQYIDDSKNGWLPFWSSMQGKHLQYYLTNFQKFTEEEISQLNYSQTIYWWKEYINENVRLTDEGNQLIINAILNEQRIINYAKNVLLENFNPTQSELISFLDEFNNKELVQPIVEIYDRTPESTTLKFSFKLINSNLLYQINPEEVFINVQFKNQIDESKTLINFSISEQYINEIISANTKQQFLGDAVLLFERNRLFISTDPNLGKVTYSIFYDSNMNKVVVKFVFIDKNDEAKYRLSIYERYFEPNFSIDPSTSEGIFNNVPNNINLATIFKNKQEVIDLIQNLIQINIDKQYLINDHYTIYYSTNLVENLIIPATSTVANPFTLNVVLNVTNNQNDIFGYKVIKIINQLDVDVIPTLPDNDLSKIELIPLEFNLNSPEELKLAVINNLNGQLKKYNLVLDETVEIINFDSIISSLFISIGTYNVDLIITSKVNGIIGEKKINLKNTTNQSFMFDLSKISITDQNLGMLQTKNEIYNKLKEVIQITIFDSFNFQKNQIKIGITIQKENEQAYWLEWDSIEFMRSLVEKNPPEWIISKTLEIRDQTSVLTHNSETNISTWEQGSLFLNHANLSVINSSNPEKPYEPDWDKEEKDKVNATIIWSSVLVAVLAIAGTSILIIVIRKRSKKIR